MQLIFMMREWIWNVEYLYYEIIMVENMNDGIMNGVSNAQWEKLKKNKIQ